jgi:hypothetical protein
MLGSLTPTESWPRLRRRRACRANKDAKQSRNRPKSRKDASDLWKDENGALWSENGSANLGERVDQGTSFWFALQDHHPATAAWMTSRPQDEVEFDDGELPGYMPVIVLGVLFMATSFWKKGRGQA